MYFLSHQVYQKPNSILFIIIIENFFAFENPRIKFRTHEKSKKNIGYEMITVIFYDYRKPLKKETV